jgi:hypothetical protein
MKSTRLSVLLVVWLVFLCAPALSIELGLFGHFDMNTSITGAAIGLWIVGYLAQFGVFMWLMNVAGSQNFLWWFAASLLPWAIDWTLPVSPLFGLLWFPLAIGMAVWIGAGARSDESFRERAVHATGVVLEVIQPAFNVVINNVYIKRKVRLRVERADRTPRYEGVLNGLFMLGEIPSVGDRLALLVDPQNPQRIKSDDAASSTDGAPAAPAYGTAKKKILG